MIGSPIAKGLVGLGMAGTGITSIVLVTSKSKQQSESERKQLELQRINNNSSKLYEECGENLSKWNEHDPYRSGKNKEVKNNKDKNEAEWQKCSEKYWPKHNKR